jgi:PhnB protein
MGLPGGREGGGNGVRSGADTSLIFGRGHAEAALEVAVQVTLVGEAGGGGRFGDRLAGFEQAAGHANPVRELQRMGWQAGALAEKADETELADPGRGGQLIEADIAPGMVGQIVARPAYRLVVGGAERRSPRAPGRGMCHQGAQPFSEPLVALEPSGGRLERRVQGQEVSDKPGIRDHWLEEGHVGQDAELVVARELGQSGDLNDHEPGRPRPGIEGHARVRAGRVPGDKLPGQDNPAFTAAPGTHRLPSDDAEDVLASWLDGIVRGLTGHQQDAVLAGGAPHPDLLGCHAGRLCGTNVQDDPAWHPYGGVMLITPHIVVQGAQRAAAFYRDAFGAEEIDRIPVPGGRLMSVQLRLGAGLLYLADEFPEMGVLAPPSIGGTAVVLALDVDDAEAVFAQAITAGAEVRQPLADVFWGDRHGQLQDPFGHRWNVSQHLRDVPHGEVVAGAAIAFAAGPAS